MIIRKDANYINQVFSYSWYKKVKISNKRSISKGSFQLSTPL